MASLHASASMLPKVAPDPGTPDAAAWDDPEERDRYTRWQEGEGGARIGESAFAIEGMYCAACSVAIEQALQAVPGVHDADVNPATRRARVRWEDRRTRPSALIAAVERAGYRATPAL